MSLKEILFNGLAGIFIFFAFHGYIDNVWVAYFYSDWERVYFNKCFALTFLGYGAMYLFLDKEEIFDDYLAQFCRPDQLEKFKVGWNSRVISVFNATTISLFSIHGLLNVDFSKMISDLFWADYPRFYAATISPTLAGYLYDFSLADCFFFVDCILILTLLDLPIVFHHSLLIAVIYFGGKHKLLFGLCVVYALNELSTIFLNFRWFFHKLNSAAAKEGKTVVPEWLVQANLLAFITSFFVIRVVGNIFFAIVALYMEFIGRPSSHIYFKLFLAFFIPAICLMNIYWFSSIVQRGMEMFEENKQKKGEKAN